MLLRLLKRRTLNRQWPAFKKELVKIKIRTRNVIILLSVVALVMIVTLGINNYKAKQIAKIEDHISELKLKQAKFEFRLELQSFPDDKQLSEIEDLNTLLEPTKQTFKLLERWEIAHQVDPDYPYPADEINKQDWMGMNYFLYGDLDDEDGGAKAKMIYDENMNIDRDVYDYIGTGDASSDHPVVQEVEKRIKGTE
jgi:hypothetical protein